MRVAAEYQLPASQPIVRLSAPVAVNPPGQDGTRVWGYFRSHIVGEQLLEEEPEKKEKETDEEEEETDDDEEANDGEDEMDED